MRQTDIQVKIVTPCSESRDAMSESNVGYYCHSCQKDVIDFTALTDVQLRRVLDELKGKPMCGMFRTDQVNRPLPAPPTQPLWQRAVGRVAASYVLLQSLVHTAVAQTISAKATTEQQAAVTTTEDSVVITGQVLDAYSQLPAEGVHLLIKRGSARAVTNKSGYFELKVTGNGASNEYLIETDIDAQKDGFVIDDMKVNMAEYNAGKPLVLYRYIGGELPKAEYVSIVPRIERHIYGGAIISGGYDRTAVTTIYMWKVWAFFAKPFKRKHHAH